MSVRPVKNVRETKATIEGAGVRLQRAFGFGDTGEFDPFLLLDDFRNDVPADYRAGFPWHPHRGIETITYVLAGNVAHADSLGNKGSLGAGDVQWMTAGRGILHQEMPQGDPQGRMHGFQLWANLPASLKMTAPRYQDIAARDIPEVTEDDGTTARQERMLAALGLPVRAPALDVEPIVSAMARDKKAKDGRVPFVLAPRIGAFRIVYDVPATEIRAAIASLAS